MNLKLKSLCTTVHVHAQIYTYTAYRRHNDVVRCKHDDDDGGDDGVGGDDGGDIPRSSSSS